MIDKIKMIVFDLDGTLIDTSVAVEYAFIHVFQDALNRGIVEHIPTHEVIMSTFGLLDNDIWNLLAPSMSNDLKAYYRRMYDVLLRERLLHISFVLPGVVEMLGRLSSSYTLATASNCLLTYLDTILDNSGLRSHFKYPLCAESVNASEKADILRELIRLTGHKEILMVGDRSSDVEAAKAVGIPIIGVVSKFGDSEELTQADVVLKNILDLENLLNRNV